MKLWVFFSVGIGVLITIVTVVLPDQVFGWLASVEAKILFLVFIYVLLLSSLVISWSFLSKSSTNQLHRHEKMLLRNNRISITLATAIIAFNPTLKTFEASFANGTVSFETLSLGFPDVLMASVMVAAAVFYTIYHRSFVILATKAAAN